MSLISIITGISMTGVAVGVAALVVVLSVMNGFYDFVRDLLVSLDPHVRVVSVEGRPERGADAEVLPVPVARGIAEVDTLLAIARSLEHVEQAAPYVEGKALLVPEGRREASQVVIVRGVEPASMGGVSQVVGGTGMGRFHVEREDGRPGIVLGQELGERYGLLPQGGTRAASEVALLSATAIEQVLTRPLSPPPLVRFDVRGLFELEPTYDRTHVFVDLDEAQRLFNMPERVTGIELRLDDLDEADEVQAALQARLPSDRFEVLTWYDLQRSLYDVMRLEKWGATVILLLIVIVAAFNIVGSLTMVTIEKRRDVGVLQALGVSPKGIRQIFLLEGMLVGGVGTLAGLALGLVLALLQQQFGLVPLAGAESFLLRAYPVSIRAADVALIAAVSLTLCSLAALYPARRAAAIPPAEAVQLEG